MQQSLLQLSGYDRRELLAEANRARNRGRDRRVIAVYRRILLEEPRNVEVALRAAPLLAHSGEGFEAWQLFRSAAKELFRARRYEACLGVFRDACRCIPHEFDAWRLRAELEIKLGREEAAYETLLEGRRQFSRPRERAQAIALLVRARAIEPWDPDVALDMAGLYTRTDQVGVALELLESLARRSTARQLRRVRWMQLRITLSFRHAWLWLRAVLGEPQPNDSKQSLAPPEPFEHLFPEPTNEQGEETLTLEHEVSF